LKKAEVELIQNKDLRKEGQNNLLTVVNDYVSPIVVSKKNTNKSWLYGYNDQYDLIVISKTGEIGQIVNISGLYIALPKAPKNCHQRHTSKLEQYWRESLYLKSY